MPVDEFLNETERMLKTADARGVAIKVCGSVGIFLAVRSDPIASNLYAWRSDATSPRVSSERASARRFGCASKPKPTSTFSAPGRFSPGTESSNPSPSSGESRANLNCASRVTGLPFFGSGGHARKGGDKPRHTIFVPIE